MSSTLSEPRSPGALWRNARKKILGFSHEFSEPSSKDQMGQTSSESRSARALWRKVHKEMMASRTKKLVAQPRTLARGAALWRKASYKVSSVCRMKLQSTPTCADCGAKTTADCTLCEECNQHLSIGSDIQLNISAPKSILDNLTVRREFWKDARSAFAKFKCADVSSSRLKLLIDTIQRIAKQILVKRRVIECFRSILEEKHERLSHEFAVSEAGFSDSGDSCDAEQPIETICKSRNPSKSRTDRIPDASAHNAPEDFKAQQNVSEDFKVHVQQNIGPVFVDVLKALHSLQARLHADLQDFASLSTNLAQLLDAKRAAQGFIITFCNQLKESSDIGALPPEMQAYTDNFDKLEQLCDQLSGTGIDLPKLQDALQYQVTEMLKIQDALQLTERVDDTATEVSEAVQAGSMEVGEVREDTLAEAICPIVDSDTAGAGQESSHALHSTVTSEKSLLQHQPLETSVKSGSRSFGESKENRGQLGVQTSRPSLTKEDVSTICDVLIPTRRQSATFRSSFSKSKRPSQEQISTLPEVSGRRASEPIARDSGRRRSSEIFPVRKNSATRICVGVLRDMLLPSEQEMSDSPLKDIEKDVHFPGEATSCTEDLRERKPVSTHPESQSIFLPKLGKDASPRRPPPQRRVPDKDAMSRPMTGVSDMSPAASTSTRLSASRAPATMSVFNVALGPPPSGKFSRKM